MKTFTGKNGTLINYDLNFNGTVDVIVQVADGENIQTAVVGIDGEDMNDFFRVVMGQRLMEIVEQKFFKGE